MIRTCASYLYAPVFFLTFIVPAILFPRVPMIFLGLLLTAIGVSLLAERLLPFHADWNRDQGDLKRDLAHGVTNHLVIVCFMAGMAFSAKLGLLPSLGIWPVTWPLWAQVILALVISDALMTLGHYVSHRNEFLWRLHSIHHSVQRVYSLNGLMKHPLHKLFEGALGFVPLFIAGMPFGTGIVTGYTCAIIFLLAHSNVDMRIGFLSRIFAFAPVHRYHHLPKRRSAVNYGISLNFWDMLLGTFQPVREEVNAELRVLGLKYEKDFPVSYRSQLIVPFSWKWSVLIIFSVLSTADVNAYFEHSENSPAEMNGIKFSDHKDFTTEWKLVTVRYRDDSKEIRMTYANDIALKALKEMVPKYPDGAKFGKISFFSEEDPAFPSSRVPSGTRRFQVMVRDQKRYKDTDGWGYALFDQEGKLYKEDVKEKTEACVACHRLVPERQFVFSRSFHASSVPDLLLKSKTRSPGITFRPKKRTDFQGAILGFLPATLPWVESLEGELQKHAFSGTLDEIVPLLLERTRLMGKDSVLYVNPRNFTLVRQVEKQDSCLGERSKAVEILIFFNGGKVREALHCI